MPDLRHEERSGSVGDLHKVSGTVFARSSAGKDHVREPWSPTSRYLDALGLHHGGYFLDTRAQRAVEYHRWDTLSWRDRVRNFAHRQRAEVVRMKKIDLYLIRENVIPFLIGSLTVVLMFQINLYMAFAKEMNLAHVPPSAIFQLILYRTPSFLPLTLPTSCSLGASLAMSRLARESELTALRAAGASIRRVLLPFGAWGVVVALASYIVVTKIQPKADLKADQRMVQIGVIGHSGMLNSNVPLKFDEKYAMFLGEVQQVNATTMSAKDVLLVDYPDHRRWHTITAKKVVYQNGIWTFSEAYDRIFDGQDLISLKQIGKFAIRWKIIPTDIFSSFEPMEQGPEQLQATVDTLTRAGGNPKPTQIRIYNLYSLPAACIVMAFVSPIFAILFARSGGFAGVLLGSLLVILYYNVYVVCNEILGKLPWVPAWTAAWLPVFLFGFAGLIAIRRIE